MDSPGHVWLLTFMCAWIMLNPLLNIRWKLEIFLRKEWSYNNLPTANIPTWAHTTWYIQLMGDYRYTELSYKIEHHGVLIIIRYRSTITSVRCRQKKYISDNYKTPLKWWHQLYGKGSCVISFNQRDVSVCQNIYTTKSTTICTENKTSTRL